MKSIQKRSPENKPDTLSFRSPAASPKTMLPEECQEYDQADPAPASCGLTKENTGESLFSKEKILSILFGTALLSFGLYNIHQQSGITEGGVLGMILLLNHWFGIPPAILSPALDAVCYILGFKYLGKDFLKLSVAATISLAFFFWLWECFPPVLPDLSGHPLIAALAGGLFVGLGVSFVVRYGASSGGDDALALVISKLTRCRLSRSYLVTDLTVLTLSLSYIPLGRIVFSLITVTVSSLLIDFMLHHFQKKKKTEITS